jgi:putative transposase
MRTVNIASGEYYHILNRGNNKQVIFLDDYDWSRFLFLILYFQSPVVLDHVSRQAFNFVKNKNFNISEQDQTEIVKKRLVELVNFALMPNHFHLTVRQVKENGIAQYMQRVLCAYTKYFNTKYKKSGHLFQGPYKAVHVENNNQLLYLSAYIHRNPREIKKWKNKEQDYPWSSYQDYVKENRWGQLIQQDIILEQFCDKKDYEKFLQTSTAKDTVAVMAKTEL